jgi:aminopeptidase YwaD
MKKHVILAILLFAVHFVSFSQNIEYAREIINKLSTREMAGRGYVNKGDQKAAKYIANELSKNKVLSFGKSYFQEFPVSVNTYPKTVELKMDGKTVEPGTGFVLANSPLTTRGKFELTIVDKTNYADTLQVMQLARTNLKGKFLLIDTLGFSNAKSRKLMSEIIRRNPMKAAGILEITDKTPQFSLAPMKDNYIHLRVRRGQYQDNPKEIEVNIKNKYLDKYITQNVAGYVQGETDTFMVFTAHYDHLGQMGSKTWFPGANDNCCGVAMVLDLARYYAGLKQKPHYSMAFILFSGEEIGLLGSFYYAQNPLFPLAKIKFLNNLDVIGSGEDGIKIVNSEVFKPEYELLAKINGEKNYVKSIQKRGAAANSDHYPFYEKTVRSFFIYSLGKYSEYHNVADKPEGLPMFAYENLFRLLTDFCVQYR